MLATGRRAAGRSAAGVLAARGPAADGMLAAAPPGPQSHQFSKSVSQSAIPTSKSVINSNQQVASQELQQANRQSAARKGRQQLASMTVNVSVKYCLRECPAHQGQQTGDSVAGGATARGPWTKCTRGW